MGAQSPKFRSGAAENSWLPTLARYSVHYARYTRFKTKSDKRAMGIGQVKIQTLRAAEKQAATSK